MDDWRENLIDDSEGIARIWRDTRRIAVLGIKTEAQPGQPAFYVPEYLQAAGLEVVPVPVYFPDVARILGQPVYRSVAEVPGEVDLVDVFRRPKDVELHHEELLAKKPKAVWMQLGIRNDAVAEKLAEAGIKVVQDRCLMVDYGRLAPSRSAPR